MDRATLENRIQEIKNCTDIAGKREDMIEQLEIDTDYNVCHTLIETDREYAEYKRYYDIYPLGTTATIPDARYPTTGLMVPEYFVVMRDLEDLDLNVTEWQTYINELEN